MDLFTSMLHASAHIMPAGLDILWEGLVFCDRECSSSLLLVLWLPFTAQVSASFRDEHRGVNLVGKADRPKRLLPADSRLAQINAHSPDFYPTSSGALVAFSYHGPTSDADLD